MSAVCFRYSFFTKENAHIHTQANAHNKAPSHPFISNQSCPASIASPSDPPPQPQAIKVFNEIAGSFSSMWGWSLKINVLLFSLSDFFSPSIVFIPSYSYFPIFPDLPRSHKMVIHHGFDLAFSLFIIFFSYNEREWWPKLFPLTCTVWKREVCTFW